jgi:site-specific recombinase XerD
VLSLIKRTKHQVALATIYSCGLRLNEGIHLKVSDIDADRMLVWVRNGKGGRDRYVPLPARTLKRIQLYKRRFAPTGYLFPSRDDRKPLHETTLQRAFRNAVRRSGIDKAATIRTLRHSYATHLLESGVDLRIIQTILGHRSANTTAIYTHLTQRSVSVVRTALADLMADL